MLTPGKNDKILKPKQKFAFAQKFLDDYTDVLLFPLPYPNFS